MASSHRGHQRSLAGARTVARQALLTGFALTVPLFVTLLVVGFVVNTLSNVLNPLVVFLFGISGAGLQQSETPAAVVKVVAFVVLLTGVFSLGLAAEQWSGAERIDAVADATVKQIPGIGSLYNSFDEMSNMLLDSDTQSFQEVVLVEHPTAHSYTVAFVTASTPPSIERATDNDEMVTLFMPMAPNPVMGGHVVHVPTDRVHDVDMSVEEGIRSIVTSGVAIGEGTVETPVGGEAATDPAQVGYQFGTPVPGHGGEPERREREAAYRDDLDPEHARTPESVAREHSESVGAEAARPAELDRTDETLGSDAARPESLEGSGGAVGPASDTSGTPDSGREEQD